MHTYIHTNGMQLNQQPISDVIYISSAMTVEWEQNQQ